VIEGLHKAVELAEAGYKGLVIWSPDDVFSAGANLEALMPVFMKSGAKGIAPEVKKLQDTMLRVRYAKVPVVAAMRGLALGGGCEIAVATAPPRGAHGKLRRPGRSGRGPDARRRRPDLHRPPRRRDGAPGNANADLLKFLKDGFTNAAMAKVGTSALESRKLGYLLDGDIVVPTRTSCCTWPSTRPRRWPTAATARRQGPVPGGRPQCHRHHQGPAGGHARRRLHQRARLPHRQLIAEVVCGGDVDAGSMVTEEYLMALERKRFCALLEHPKTPGAGHGHAADRQARAQLSGATRHMSKQVQDAYIVAATRTPSASRPRLLPQHPPRRPAGRRHQERAGAGAQALDPKAIEDAIIGCSFPEGEQGMNMARVAVVLAGLPNSVGGVTVNRFCASGLTALQMAADRIRVGEADVMIAGGAES
jgi:hypothetical protein